MPNQGKMPSYLYEDADRENGSDGKKRRAWSAAAAVILVLALAAGGFYWYAKSVCEKALEQADALEFAEASATFRAVPLGQKIFPIESEYVAAGELAAAGRYAEAIDAFGALGIYREAPAALKQTRYLLAKEVLESGEYLQAADLFAALGDYRDSADQAFGAKLLRADALAASGNYKSAKDLLRALGDEGYGRAKDELVEVCKQCAASYADHGQYGKAYGELLEAQSEDGADVDALLSRYRSKAYESGVSCYRESDFAAAKAQFSAIGDYKDAEDYLFLIEVHNKTSWSTAEAAAAAARLASLILKEDAADLLMSGDELAGQFLLGYWEGSGHYLSMGADGYLSYDLPYVDFGDYYYISQGAVLLYEDGDSYNSQPMFFIRAVTANCIQVYAYKDGHSYTLFRG